jgi:hypothetical protein
MIPIPEVPTPSITQTEVQSALPTLDRMRQLDGSLIDPTVGARYSGFRESASQELESVALCDTVPDERWSPPSDWPTPIVSAAISYPGRQNIMGTAESPSITVMLLALNDPGGAASWLNQAQSLFQLCERWQRGLSTFERIDLRSSGSGAWTRWASIGESPAEWSLSVRANGQFVALAYIDHSRSSLLTSYSGPLDVLLDESLARLSS